MDSQIALKLRASIKRHEGLKKFPYRDSVGKLTIGYGRNISDVGISETEADIMLNDDIVNATADLYRHYPWTQDLDDVRKAVLIEMSFNLGIGGLMEFRNMLQHVQCGDYEIAAKDMLASDWAKQVGNRAHDLAFSMEKGIL